MKKEEKMQICYTKAKEYLIEITPLELQGEELRKYFNIEKTFKTKSDILYGLLGSLQNGNRMPNVIGLWNENRRDIFEQILYQYDAESILQQYDADSLYEEFCANFNVKNKDSKNNLWMRYSKSIISASKFISGFETAVDFDNFISSFSNNRLSSVAAPLILEKEVFGLGFTLACDFLKEMGYSQYPKPDVHIKDIFSSFGLCEDNDYEAYKAVIEMANICNDTPYNVDKVFWLIGSGKFYLHDVNIGGNKKDFINKVQNIFLGEI
ncbi:hypothetical protein [Clostridium ljungdahlii]|uniref:Uncharacterized protein n=1 Tax=Clostridium ljungdahlii TaxID=1538 RepID=A0A168MHE2_9CLOT|nr:hypothetical protein [Clostridium ljungdahlii]OAA84693.1 hypothetical protein WY13_02592 [Clostridium ljungdahlii]